MSDDEKSGGGVAGFVGGAAGLAGTGYFADRVAKGGLIKKITGPEFVKVFRKDGLEAAMKAVGIDAKHKDAVENLIKHEDVKKADIAADDALSVHLNNSNKVVQALQTGKVDGKAVESLTFVAGENGTYVAQVKVKGVEAPLELKGIKTLPEGAEVGKAITDTKAIQAIGATHTEAALSWLHQTAGHDLAHTDVKKVVIKNVNGKHTVEVHLTEEAAKAKGIESGIITVENVGTKALPQGVAVAKGAEHVIEGEALQGLTKAGQHGWLKQATLDAEAAVHGQILKPLQDAMRKAAGFGFGFKTAGMAGKAGIIGAAAVGTYAGAKIIGGLFGGGGSHADRIEAERRTAAATDPAQTRQ